MQIIESGLNALGVHELRAIARTLGVKAPTTKKRDQLVEEILKIKRGEQVGIKSKMGRPPKNHQTGFAKISELMSNKSTVDMVYDRQNIEISKFSDKVVYENQSTYNNRFFGVVREFDGQFYVRNYLGNIRFVLLEGVDFCEGQIVKGTAHSQVTNIYIARDVETVEFEDCGLHDVSDSVFCICNNKTEIVDNVACADLTNKIILEIEASATSCQTYKDLGVFLHTLECEDIVESYNMLLDLKNVVQYLTRENKKFSLFLIDVEYIYSTLVTYYQMKGVNSELNAGQYFKELIVAINQSCGGNLIMLNSGDIDANLYLKAIIKKFCNEIKNNPN